MRNHFAEIYSAAQIYEYNFPLWWSWWMSSIYSGQVTHMHGWSFCNLDIIGSDDGLLPDWHQKNLTPCWLIVNYTHGNKFQKTSKPFLTSSTLHYAYWQWRLCHHGYKIHFKNDEELMKYRGWVVLWPVMFLFYACCQLTECNFSDSHWLITNL